MSASAAALHSPDAGPGNPENDGARPVEPSGDGLTAASGPATSASANAEARIRVLLADDHRILRESLAGALRLQKDIEIVGQAEHGEQALALARKLRPDVIVMDVSMPRLDGIRATQLITGEMPDARVIGLSMHEEADKAQAMQNAGAMAYVPKTGPIQRLVETIRRCFRERPRSVQRP